MDGHDRPQIDGQGQHTDIDVHPEGSEKTQSGNRNEATTDAKQKQLVISYLNMNVVESHTSESVVTESNYDRMLFRRILSRVQVLFASFQ